MHPAATRWRIRWVVHARVQERALRQGAMLSMIGMGLSGLGRLRRKETIMMSPRDEPTLHEMLNDPIIQAMMHRDAVQERDLLMLIETIRQHTLDLAE